MNYDVLYKILIDAKPLHIMFDEVDGFVREYGENKYLVLIGLEKYHAIFHGIRYLIGLNNCILYVASHNYPKFKTDLDDDLQLEKTLTLLNAVILIK